MKKALLTYITTFLTLFFGSVSIVFAVDSVEISTQTLPTVGRYNKLEFDLAITGIQAEYLQVPYLSQQDATTNTSAFVDKGISVDATFASPSGKTHQQPAFWYQDFDQNGNWAYPTTATWKVRFAPDEVGTWKVTITAVDKGGSDTSTQKTFAVMESNHKGFIQVSNNDSRYFEYETGDFYPNTFINFDLYRLRNLDYINQISNAGVQNIRAWITHWNLTTDAWSHFIIKPETYDGYLPRTPLNKYTPIGKSDKEFWWTLRSPQSWYNNCAYNFHYHPERIAVKKNTQYLVESVYETTDVTAKNSGQDFGYVIKFGDWKDTCQQVESETTAMTNFGNTKNQAEQKITGVWNAENRNTIGYLYPTLQNANGSINIKSISIREITGGSAGNYQLGPEILGQTVPENRHSFNQKQSFWFDKVLERLEQEDVRLTLVVNEKESTLYKDTDLAGNPVTFSADNFYGNGSFDTYNMWYMQAYWRYMVARWGYSSSIQTWELLNEGDPNRQNHYALADNFAKYMKCNVFGKQVDANGKCNYDHPNTRMVTTSFWHSLPAQQFWANDAYPNIDYADVHAYISTSYAVQCRDKNPTNPSFANSLFEDMVTNNTWHGRDARSKGITKPLIRGEFGLDRICADHNDRPHEKEPDDTNRVWFHNITFSQLDHSAMTDSNWWYGDNEKALTYFRKFRPYVDFTQDLNLNKGGYQEISATASNNLMRILGQKRENVNQAYLWVQNKNHTWWKKVNGNAAVGLAGTITIDGFTTNTSLPVSWHAFDSAGNVTLSTSTVTSNAAGKVVLDLTSIDAANTKADVAIKIGSFNAGNGADVNQDGQITVADYQAIRQSFTSYSIYTFADIVSSLSN